MYWIVRRHLVRIAVLLAIGAVINVATAWACALMFDIGAAPAWELYTPLGAEHHWEVFRWDGGPGTRVVSRCWAGLAPAPHNLGWPEELLPGWMSIDPPDRDAPVIVSRIGEAWGYPMRSMSCRSESRPAADGTMTTATSGVARLRPADRRGGRGLYLPLNPVWIGFSVNTALYALLGLVVCAAGRDLGRLVRRRDSLGSDTVAGGS
jgi:hypothetical protein